MNINIWTAKIYVVFKIIRFVFYVTRLVIGTSRTVCSAKKFVRITSGFSGGEFTKTLRRVCTCQKLKFPFLLLEYCKIRECYAVANAFTIRNMQMNINIWTAKIYVVFKIIRFVFLYMHVTKLLF
jgi:hypothetical protein